MASEANCLQNGAAEEKELFLYLLGVEGTIFEHEVLD